MKRTIVDGISKDIRWLAPIGGLGDTLIFSGLLHEIFKKTGEQFGMIRRMPYMTILDNHPAIKQFAVIEDESKAIDLGYWNYEKPGPGLKRPFHILSKLLNGNTEAEEKLWVDVEQLYYDELDYFPIPDNPVVISTGTHSPRKKWPIQKWGKLVKKIQDETGSNVLQVGVQEDEAVPGTINICGKTHPKHILALMTRVPILITVDTFILHAAAWAKTEHVIAMWGPTSPKIFGYEKHCNISGNTECDDTCFGVDKYDTYMSECDKKWCMEDINVDTVYAKFKDAYDTITSV